MGEGDEMSYDEFQKIVVHVLSLGSCHLEYFYD